MKFCEKCGSLMKPNDSGSEFLCDCGHTENVGEGHITTEQMEKGITDIVVKEEGDKILLPETDADCECGNKKAYYWMEQTRSADEAPTRFYRCTKCMHTWREYS